MVIQLSDTAIKYNDYIVKREFVEYSFTFSNQRQFVSLIGEVKHFYISDDDNKVELLNLNYKKEIIASNQTKVYADNGNYVQYQEVEKTIKDEEGNDIVVKERVILEEERGIIGEFDFFQALRNTLIKINDLVQAVVLRADTLKQV